MLAFAMMLEQGGGGAQAQPSAFGMLPMMLLMVGIFYFMMIRPQQKKARQQQEWLKSLKKGDEVVTQGGIVGRISGLTDLYITLEVQEKVRIRVLRSSITGKPPEIKKAAPVTTGAEEPAAEKK